MGGNTAPEALPLFPRLLPGLEDRGQPPLRRELTSVCAPVLASRAAKHVLYIVIHDLCLYVLRLPQAVSLDTLEMLWMLKTRHTLLTL